MISFVNQRYGELHAASCARAKLHFVVDSLRGVELTINILFFFVVKLHPHVDVSTAPNVGRQFVANVPFDVDPRPAEKSGSVRSTEPSRRGDGSFAWTYSAIGPTNVLTVTIYNNLQSVYVS